MAAKEKNVHRMGLGIGKVHIAQEVNRLQPPPGPLGREAGRDFETVLIRLMLLVAAEAARDGIGNKEKSRAGEARLAVTPNRRRRGRPTSRANAPGPADRAVRKIKEPRSRTAKKAGPLGTCPRTLWLALLLFFGFFDKFAEFRNRRHVR